MPAAKRREATGEGEDVYVALGSNLGDRRARLAFAVTSLAHIPGLHVVAVSSIFETDPVGPGPQGRYLNAVVQARATLPPAALLQRMLAIEVEAGRSRDPAGEKWGPRSLDLDLLAYGERRIREPGLELPHPRLHERAFVLEPLRELAPDLQLPGLPGTIEELAARVRDPAAVRVWDGPPLEP